MELIPLHKTKPLFPSLNTCCFVVFGLFLSCFIHFCSKKNACLTIHSLLFLMTLQEMQAEMEKHMAHLQQLKDFDETLALEREEKARQEQERRRMEV